MISIKGKKLTILNWLQAIVIIFICLPIFSWANNVQIAKAAQQQVGKTLVYDPSYTVLAYPMGDIPLNRGVCTDVVIRALRSSHKVDLQQLVHEDMRQHFAVYPKMWGLTKPDKNIDHRRVPNLEVFFKRQGKSLPVTQWANDYQPGDIVSWRLDNGLPHIGIVSTNMNMDQTRLLVIHNIGWGAQEEDVLFEWKMSGHYRYYK
ncbi:DUF1287 domain-containing protein [Entomomonas asaccharolytica]|uniref:DUF1287 domain-containing protein n=1 Tax=Entomomonas asaccharolytica TaxID=2785331 RepID=A0A974NI60_9GAMM|nr:DUF1287 domain-containing protein [Entomomonas asaccharolytica]QQP87012.1 DUF1287 domain-containing protein [Entomomonas asaccharolytica]